MFKKKPFFYSFFLIFLYFKYRLKLKFASIVLLICLFNIIVIFVIVICMKVSIWGGFIWTYLCSASTFICKQLEYNQYKYINIYYYNSCKLPFNPLISQKNRKKNGKWIVLLSEGSSDGKNLNLGEKKISL